MIKFFRRIRKTLIEQGKTTKYLKYAIGEILLVVIGILIALGVNNQNTLKKERKIEHEYKERLIAQFQKDSIFLAKFNTNMQFINPYLHKLDSILQSIEKNDLGMNEVVQIPVFLTLQTQFITETTVIEELNSTGNMSLIQNIELKDALVTYQNAVSRQIFMIANTSESNSKFDDYLIEHGALKGSFYDIEVNYLNDEFVNRYWFVKANKKGFSNSMTTLEEECAHVLNLLRS